MQIETKDYSNMEEMIYSNIKSIEVRDDFIILDYGNGVSGSILITEKKFIQIKDSPKIEKK